MLFRSSVIRDLGAETIQAIIDKLSSLDPPPIRPSDLHRALKDILPDRLYEANILMRQLMSLYTLRRQRGVSAKELLEGLSRSITTAEPRWNDEEISRWNALEPQLQSLLSLSVVWTVVKGLDLSYDYTNLLQNAKILTDIRPVFDEDASNIQGAVVSYTLRLYFDSLEGSKSLSIALDEKDVEKLLKVCERALKKAKTAKNFMHKHDVKRTFIPGEEE